MWETIVFFINKLKKYLLRNLQLFLLFAQVFLLETLSVKFISGY